MVTGRTLVTPPTIEVRIEVTGFSTDMGTRLVTRLVTGPCTVPMTPVCGRPTTVWRM